MHVQDAASAKEKKKREKKGWWEKSLLGFLQEWFQHQAKKKFWSIVWHCPSKPARLGLATCFNAEHLQLLPCLWENLGFKHPLQIRPVSLLGAQLPSTELIRVLLDSADWWQKCLAKPVLSSCSVLGLWREGGKCLLYWLEKSSLCRS